MKKAISVLIVFIGIFVLFGVASAAILADPIFHAASTNLSSTKTALFAAVTKGEMNSIKVTQVQLYKQISGTWQLIGNLPVPTDEAVNTDLFGTNMDYSSSIGSGTYRLYTTFCADGYSISRYSNTRTF